MSRSSLVTVLLCVAVLACEPEMSTRERLVEQQRVEAALTTWARLMNNARTDSLSAMYVQTPAVHVVRVDGQIGTGWEAVQEGQRIFFGGLDYMNFVLQNPNVELLTPELALATFRHSTDIVRGGARQPVVTGGGTILWERDPTDDRWKIRLEHVSVTPSAN